MPVPRELANQTAFQIIEIISIKPSTNTEIYQKLKHKIKYHQSIHKTLKKLLNSEIIARKYYEKKGFVYSINFKEIKIGNVKIVYASN